MQADKSSSHTLPGNRTVNCIAGLLFCVLGVLVIIESRRFESSGSTTPIFIGTVIIALALGLIATAFLAPRYIPPIQKPQGSLGRRTAGASVIVVWVFALPYLGFLPSSIIAFITISFIVPQTRQRTLYTCLVHAVIGTVIVILFWYVLTRYLGIALPATKLSEFS